MPEGRACCSSGVARVRIEPAAVDAASHHAPAIFGAGTDERVHHALSRVQAMLGHRGVLTPAIGGGRWLAERQVLVPWGDRAVAREGARAPLAGEPARPAARRRSSPSPCRCEVTADGGGAVGVDARGRITAAPAVLTESGRRAGDRGVGGSVAGHRAGVGCRALPPRAPVPGRRCRPARRGCWSAKTAAGRAEARYD